MHHERKDGEDVTHVSTTEARSASPSRLNRNVLVASLVLVLFFLAAVVGFGFLDTSRSGADDVNGNNAIQSAPAS